MTGQHIYFLRSIGARPGGPVKIGCSEDPIRRLRVYCEWSPSPLEILATIPNGTIELESAIHAHFNDLRMHHEWFRGAPKLVNFIAKIQAGVPLKEALPGFDEHKRSPYLKARRRPWTESAKRRLSYSSRLEHAFYRRGLAMPNDVSEIMARWTRGCLPTQEEIFRLDEALSDPALHGTLRKAAE